MSVNRMEYTLIRSKRKTISLQVKGNDVIVRAPNRMAKRDIESFVRKHEGWIAAQREKNAAAARSRPAPLTAEELGELTLRARQVIPKRVAYYAGKIGVEYGKVTIRRQRTRWGSCSTKRNLNFNCLLMLMPDEVIDAVVVHELCHLLHMNHSPAFYREVERIYPEYRRWNRWLKENGRAILERLENE